jgi:hypothetical protein
MNTNMKNCFSVAIIGICVFTADASLSTRLRGVAGKLEGMEDQLKYSKQVNPNVDPKCLEPRSMIPEVCDAPWIFCIDAVCEDTPTMVDGIAVSKCKCWEQKKSHSFIPAKDQGAACVMGYEGGKSMCDDMQTGSLVSSYWLKPEDGHMVPNNSSFLPPSARAVCPAGTQFAYCWGAKCNKVKNEKTGEEDVICDCPIMTGNGDVTVEAATCTAGQDPCAGIHNSNPPGLTAGSNDKAIYNYKNGDSCDAAGTYTRM